MNSDRYRPWWFDGVIDADLYHPAQWPDGPQEQNDQKPDGRHSGNSRSSTNSTHCSDASRNGRRLIARRRSSRFDVLGVGWVDD